MPSLLRNAGGNLNNGIRVLSTRGVSRAFGRAKTGTNITGTNAPQLPPFLAANNLKAFISDDLLMLLKEPIRYRTRIIVSRSGVQVGGVESTGELGRSTGLERFAGINRVDQV